MKRLLLLIIAIYIFCGLINAQSEKEPDLNIINSNIIYDFELNNGVVNAILTVQQQMVPTGSYAYYKKAIFFDEYSSIESIKLNKKRVSAEVSDYEMDGIFHNDVKMAAFSAKLTPGKKANELIYSKRYTDIKFLDIAYFYDYQFPIKKSRITINIPKWLECRLEKFNFEDIDIMALEKKEVDYTSYIFEQANVKAPKNETGIPSRSKLFPHVMIIPQSYSVNGKKKNLFASVDDLYAWYNSLVTKVDNDESILKSKVTELIKDQSKPIDKVKAIYYWVQDNIRYIAFEYGIMGFQPEACQDVYSNKYGDCKGMANLTKEMLKIAGFDARLTWIGTSDIPYTYDYPTLHTDNHMICTVILDGEKIFLDPTEKYGSMYNYANRIQGQEALIEDGDSYILETVPELAAKKNELQANNSFSIKEDKLIGNGQILFKGNRKTDFLNMVNFVPKGEQEEWLVNYLSNNNKNVKIALEDYKHPKNRDKDVNINYDIELDNYILELADEKYVNLDFDNEFANMEIPDERTLPYEFKNKYFYNTTSKIDIPSGWKSTYIPESIKIDTDKYSFDLSYTKNDQQIIYNKRITIKKQLLRTKDFEQWNKTIHSIKEFYEDQLIFSK